MSNRTPPGQHERQHAHPVPDPDSLAMDDRGTRTYRGNHGSDRPEQVPDPDGDGNYIGDPIKREDTIRADDGFRDDGLYDDLIEDWTPAASDAPTIIRDVNRKQ
jgi:hypothetical protein